MNLTYNPDQSLFVMRCTREESGSLRDNGFRFCSGYCEAKWKCPRCAGRDLTALGAVWYTAQAECAARFAAIADEACREVLGVTLARQALSSASDADIAIPVPAGYALRPFQKAGVAYIRDVWTRYKGALLADEMGLGKSPSSLALINLHDDIRRVLILCPKSLQINWFREAERWLIDKVEPWKCYIAEESLPIPADANLVIVNYDKLVGRPGAIVAPSLVAHGKWDLVIYDEAHYCKNPKAARAEVALKGLPPAARRLLFLTGTPIENRPIELHPILEACAPDEFPFWDYAKRFCDAKEKWVGGKQKRAWDFTGHSNLEQLNARLRGTVMVRRLKEDVLKELPAKIRQVVELDAGDAEGLLDAETEIVSRHPALLQEGAPFSFSGQVGDLTRGAAVAFTELAAIRHELGVAKIEPALEWIRTALDSGVKKMIVWSWHHDVIDGLEEGLSAYLGGPWRETVREMDRSASSGGAPRRGVLDVPLRVRDEEGGRGWQHANRAQQGVHGVPPDETRSVAVAGVSDVDSGSAAIEEGRDPLHDYLEGYSHSQALPAVGYPDLPRAEKRDDQPIVGSNRPSEGLHSGKRVGRQHASEYAEAQSLAGRVGKNRSRASVARVDGRVSAEDRQEAVDRFQNDPNCRVFIGQTSAAGVGLTLTAASTVVFVESDWVPGKITQAEDRAHRIGQVDSVNVYHLAFNRSLDARMLQVIIEKQGVQDAALDSTIAIPAVTAETPRGESALPAVGEPNAVGIHRNYPLASFEERVAAKQALRILSENCDGARQEDGVGFNKLDSRFGKELAAKRLPLTDGQVHAAKKVIRKYRRQVPATLLEVLFRDDEDGDATGSDLETEEAP